MKKLYLKKQSGFSLVEMLVSISILLLVITGPMTVTSRTAKSATFATEQVQAFFLAQEGLELAQKSRDDLLLTNIATPAIAWTAFTNPSGDFSFCYVLTTGCRFKWSSDQNSLDNPEECTGSSCRLYRNQSIPAGRSLYTYTATNNILTPYTRKITFTLTPDNKGVRVVSTVTWRTGSLVAEQKVEVETYLYNIYGS